MNEVLIDGIIGYDVMASEVRDALGDGDAQLRINTPGGLVDEGIAIYNTIRNHKRKGHSVDGAVIGLAASMGTYIASAAGRLTVEDNAVWMVHNPTTFAWGDHRDMTKTAGVLESLRGVLANAYIGRTKRAEAEIHAEMDAESWFYGQGIVDAGYADEVVAAGDGPDDEAAALALANGAFSRMKAKVRDSVDQVDRIAALIETPTLEAERARAEAIMDACTAARLPSMAAKLIRTGVSVDQARAEIIAEWAKGGNPIDTRSGEVSVTFDGLLTGYIESGLSRAAAMRRAIAEAPDLYESWLNDLQKRGK